MSETTQRVWKQGDRVRVKTRGFSTKGALIEYEGTVVVVVSDGSFRPVCVEDNEDNSSRLWWGHHELEAAE